MVDVLNASENHSDSGIERSPKIRHRRLVKEKPLSQRAGDFRKTGRNVLQLLGLMVKEGGLRGM